MSHITRTSTKLSDDKLLSEALQSEGHLLRKGPKKIRDFFGQEVTVDYYIVLSDGHIIGFRWNEMTSTFDVLADWTIIKGFTQKEFIGKLNQRYAYHATLHKLEEQGFDMVEEKVEETGQIHLVLRRMA